MIDKLHSRSFFGFHKFRFMLLVSLVWMAGTVVIGHRVDANDAIAIAMKDAKIVTQPGEVIEKGIVITFSPFLCSISYG